MELVEINNKKDQCKFYMLKETNKKKTIIYLLDEIFLDNLMFLLFFIRQC